MCAIWPTSARLNGHTWRDIAQALATSPDEARLRLDPTPGRRRPLALRHLAAAEVQVPGYRALAAACVMQAPHCLVQRRPRPHRRWCGLGQARRNVVGRTGR